MHKKWMFLIVAGSLAFPLINYGCIKKISEFFSCGKSKNSHHKLQLTTNLELYKNKDLIIRHYDQKVDRAAFQKLFQECSHELGTTADDVDDDAIIFVASHKKSLIGFIVFSLLEDDTQGYIDYLAVHHDHRKQGCGYALLDHAVQSLKKAGVQEILLNVGHNNRSAQNLYKKYGFHDNGGHHTISTEWSLSKVNS